MPTQVFPTTVIQPEELELSAQKKPLSWAGCRRVYYPSHHHPFQNQAGSCRIIQVTLHHAPSALGRFASHAARCGAALQPMAPKARDEKGEQESV